MEDFPTRRLHDVLIRTRGDDPELASGLTVDGNELLIPTGTRVTISMSDDDATTVVITLIAGSLRVEHEGD